MDSQSTIKQLEAILNSGTLEGQVDGQRVKFASPEQLRHQIVELQRRDCTQKMRRPAASTIKLGGW